MSILWDISNYTKIEELPCPVITSGTENMGNGVYKLKAGTPMKKSTKAVANNGNADCIVAEDYFFISTRADQSKLVPVITQGYVDLDKAEAAYGTSYADAAKSALATAGIVLVDGALEAGGGLPEVSADDNGDVLTVVSGEWAKAAPSGGVSPFVHPVAEDETVSLDKTAGEILSMLDSGVMPVFTFVREVEDGFEQALYLQLSQTAQSESSISFVFGDDAPWACAELTDYPVYGWEPDDDNGGGVDAGA